MSGTARESEKVAEGSYAWYLQERDHFLRSAFYSGKEWLDFDRIRQKHGFSQEVWDRITREDPALRVRFEQGVVEGEQEILRSLHDMTVNKGLDKPDLVKVKLHLYLLARRLGRGRDEKDSDLEFGDPDEIEKAVITLIRDTGGKKGRRGERS